MIVLCFLDFKQRISMMVERLCEDLNSTSSTFHLQDCNLLLRNGGGLSEGDVTSESCEILPSRAAAVQGDVLSPNSGKVKGKQKGAKNISKDVKVKVCYSFTYLIVDKPKRFCQFAFEYSPCTPTRNITSHYEHG